ncbi:PTS sugar transporter subunit IIB [Corynebacterium pacaense]|uniref:PTS sugar transporter subunit IIB n=1 Tax=Corynebacterium pacaense TaxID=1816684 RepID=UPI0009BC13BF|nr:PTS sugar transporter subunit IIB [Corynebacterium pacaense]
MFNGIVLARVDQRLVHGIVVTRWATETRATRIMVIDDTVSRDEMLKSSMRLSKPVGTGMSIIDTDKAIANFLAGNYANQRVLIVVKEPATYLRLAEAGVEIPGINLGIIFYSEGKKKLSSWVAVDEREEADLRALRDRGIPLSIRYVPSDPEQPLTEI